MKLSIPHSMTYPSQNLQQQWHFYAVLEKLKAYKKELKDTVVGKAEKLDKLGYKEYMANK